jgi:hypothetical protein
MVQPAHLTIEEAAIYVGLSKGALAQRRYLGQPPTYRKLGKSVFYAVDALDSWLAASERSGTTQVAA